MNTSVELSQERVAAILGLDRRAIEQYLLEMRRSLRPFDEGRCSAIVVDLRRYRLLAELRGALSDVEWELAAGAAPKELRHIASRARSALRRLNHGRPYPFVKGC